MGLESDLCQAVGRATRLAVLDVADELAAKIAAKLEQATQTPAVVDTQEGARLVGVSARTIRAWKKAGRLRSVGRGKSDKYRVEDLFAALAWDKGSTPSSVIDISAAASRIAGNLCTTRPRRRRTDDEDGE